jgi:hypothetical protein
MKLILWIIHQHKGKKDTRTCLQTFGGETWKKRGKWKMYARKGRVLNLILNKSGGFAKLEHTGLE